MESQRLGSEIAARLVRLGVWRPSMNVIASLFTTEFWEDGSHSPRTLTEYASQFLADIEYRFGSRDRSFSLVGIDIDRTRDKPPHLWFPDTGIAPDDAERRSRHVVIRLGPHALADPARARWQLAHECFHLLDPWNERVDGRPASRLEEGLASWYQNSCVPEAEHRKGLYSVAENLVRPLMDELPNAVKRIRQERNLRISEITPHVLQNFCPGISADISRELCQPFSIQTESAMLDATIESRSGGDVVWMQHSRE